MDLRKFSDSQLKQILAFTSRLAEQTKASAVDFEDVDLEGAEKQGREYARRRNAGHSHLEIAEDAEVRSDVREWLRRTGRISRDSE